MDNYQVLGLRDIIGLCLYVLIYTIIRKYIQRIIGSEFNLFERALFAWLIGNILFFLLFYFYYGWGDTFNYYAFGMQLLYFIIDYPSTLFDIYFSSEILQLPFISYSYFSFMPNLGLLSNHANFFVTKIIATGLFFTLGSYLTLSFVFTIASFIGCWLIYSVFRSLYLPLKTYLYYSILYLPNIIFWGNGISKEAIYLSGLGILFYNFYHFFIAQDKNWQRIIYILIGSYIVYSVKSYVFFCFFPTLIFWYFLKFFYNSTYSLNAKVLTFFVMLISISLLSLFVDVNNIAKDFTLNSILENALGYGNLVYDLSETTDGSSYTLSEFEPTLTGVINVIPEALSTALFRPYIWEIKKPINLFNAMEGILLMIIIIYLLIKIGFLNSIKYTLKSPDILFCFLFSFIFLFGVSLSSFNFGALVRYKLPGELFFIIGLCILYYVGYLKPKLNEKNNIIYYHEE
ncbi:MAG: hypothetical protein U0X91_17465 [Spirosomataceae bacterium]